MRLERGLTDHRNWPRVCVGHMEREPRRLQLRYVLGIGEGVCHVEVEEHDDAVTVFGFICSGEEEEPVDLSETCDCPVHVYLERPLGDRTVLDGHVGRVVPHRNVWAEIESRERP